MKKKLSQIDFDLVASFYNDRFKTKGDCIESVGWKNSETQDLRFEVLFRDIDPTNKTILDFGCGLADLIPFLEKKTNGHFKYIGIDISADLINEAKKKYSEENYTFLHGDALNMQIPFFDIAISSGALSYRISNNEDYTKSVIAHLYELSAESCNFNFLSSYADFNLEKNYHYSPEKLFSFSKTITKKVNLIHDYPLYEFTLQLFK